MLSPHFSRDEFACNCGCGFDTVDTETLEVLEAVREHFDSPVTITSGCRCTSYNRKVGGATNSQHRFARAADFQVEDVEPETVREWLSLHYPDLSIGEYETFTHIDTRTNGPKRWRR